MADIAKGTTFSGVSPGNQVTPQRLNEHVDNAVIQPEFFTDKTAETSAANDDYFLMWDVSANAYRKIQKQFLVPTVSAVMSGHQGLVIQNDLTFSATQLDVTADQIVMRDGSGNVRLATAFSRTVDITVYAGAPTVDGRDFSSETASTWYYVWAISDGTNDRLLLSGSKTAPTYPAGYSYGCFLGAIFNDVSSNFFASFQSGRRVLTRLNIPTTNGSPFTNVAAVVAGTFQAAQLLVCIPPDLCSEVQGFLASTSVTNCRAAVGSELAGTDTAMTNDRGFTPGVFAASGSTFATYAAAFVFNIPIKTSQQLHWTAYGSNWYMRISGYTLRD